MKYRHTFVDPIGKPVEVSEREFKMLKSSVMVSIMGHLRLKTWDRPVSVMLPVANAALLDLPAYGELADEVLYAYGVRLERDIGVPPVTPEYFIRLILPAPPITPIVGVEEMLEKDMLSYSDCRYAPKPNHLRLVSVRDAPA